MASKMTIQHLQRLREELAKVEGQLRELNGRKEGLLLALAVVSDEEIAVSPFVVPDVQPQLGRKSRQPIKEVVLRILTERGEEGANAVDIVDLARAQGLELDRNSISSLLSRFKKDGVVQHDGKKYRVPRPFPREVPTAA